VICAGSPVRNASGPLSSERDAAVLADLRPTHDHLGCVTWPILAATSHVAVAKVLPLIQAYALVAGTVITGVPTNEAINRRIVAVSAPVEA
jgi:hypothetical protein